MSDARALLNVIALCALLAPPLAAQISPGSADSTQSAAEIAAAPMATAPVSDGSARLDAYVDGIVARLRREYGLPALTISVVRNDALLLAKGYGLADLASARPVVADTTLYQYGDGAGTWPRNIRIAKQPADLAIGQLVAYADRRLYPRRQLSAGAGGGSRGTRRAD